MSPNPGPLCEFAAPLDLRSASLLNQILFLKNFSYFIPCLHLPFIYVGPDQRPIRSEPGPFGFRSFASQSCNCSYGSSLTARNTIALRRRGFSPPVIRLERNLGYPTGGGVGLLLGESGHCSTSSCLFSSRESDTLVAAIILETGC